MLMHIMNYFFLVQVFLYVLLSACSQKADSYTNSSFLIHSTKTVGFDSGNFAHEYIAYSRLFIQ